MNKIVTNGAGVDMLVESAQRLPGEERRLFITDVSYASRMRMITALALQSASHLKSQNRLSLQELTADVCRKNELAASELDMLGEYQYTLHCMTN
jgi:hypothetical protein